MLGLLGCACGQPSLAAGKRKRDAAYAPDIVFVVVAMPFLLGMRHNSFFFYTSFCLRNSRRTFHSHSGKMP